MFGSSHTRCECEWHIVLIPKYRKKALYGQLRQELGEVFRRQARQNWRLIGEGDISRFTPAFPELLVHLDELCRVLRHVEHETEYSVQNGDPVHLLSRSSCFV